MVHSVVGQVVDGTNFFDRDEIRRQLRDVAMRDHVLLLAPRRVGKTSLLHKLKSEIDHDDGMAAVYVSVQGATSELDVLRSICSAVAKHASTPKMPTGPHAISKLAGRISELSIHGLSVRLEQSAVIEWQEAAQDLTRALRSLPGHWFVLLDEMPVFVARLLREDESGERARRFLEWFRALRQKEPGEDVALHWILAGSIGLDAIANKFRLTDTINDLRPLQLGAFADDVARSFLKALSAGEHVALTDAVIDRMLERVGWPIPYHLQVLFDELHKRLRDNSVTLETDDVDACIEQMLRQSSFFNSWYERLVDELGEVGARRARALLAVCAKDPTGASASALSSALGSLVSDDERNHELHFLLDVLQNDGYVVDVQGRYQFRSSLLREFWTRRYA